MAAGRNALMQSDEDVDLNLSIPVKALIEEFACPICFNNIKVRGLGIFATQLDPGLLHHHLRSQLL